MRSKQRMFGFADNCGKRVLFQEYTSVRAVTMKCGEEDSRNKMSCVGRWASFHVPSLEGAKRRANSGPAQTPCKARCAFCTGQVLSGALAGAIASIPSLSLLCKPSGAMAGQQVREFNIRAAGADRSFQKFTLGKFPLGPPELKRQGTSWRKSERECYVARPDRCTRAAFMIKLEPCSRDRAARGTGQEGGGASSRC
jgi:hypothetical protein